MSDEADYLSLGRTPELAWGDHRLSRTDLAVLVAIGKHSKPDGSSFPSQELLGSYAGVGRRRANKAVQTLIKFGYLMVLARDPQRKRRCLYQLLPGSAPVAPAGGAGTETKCAGGGAQQAAPVDKDPGYPQSAHSQNGCPQGKCAGGGAQPPDGTDPDDVVRRGGRIIVRRGGRTNQVNKSNFPPLTPPEGENGPSPGATEAMPVEGKGRGRGPRKRGSVGPAGGRAGSPRGRGARSVPSTGPPP